MLEKYLDVLFAVAMTVATVMLTLITLLMVRLALV